VEAEEGNVSAKQNATGQKDRMHFAVSRIKVLSYVEGKKPQGHASGPL
jgi:hypothetical protein